MRSRQGNHAIFDLNFDILDILIGIVALNSAEWYLTEKQWVVNNLIGIAVAYFFTSRVNLNSVSAGYIFSSVGNISRVLEWDVKLTVGSSL